MATIRNSTTLHTTYESPCGRIKVVRLAVKDFALYEDGEYVGSFDYSFQAEHAGGIWLHEQAAQVALMAAQAEARALELELGAPSAAAPTAEDAVAMSYAVSEGDVWPTFRIGAGVSTVVVDADPTSGAHLIINGVGINDAVDEWMGLQELRQLRDHLSALLDDARLAAALGEAPMPPGAPARGAVMGRLVLMRAGEPAPCAA